MLALDRRLAPVPRRNEPPRYADSQRSTAPPPLPEPEFTLELLRSLEWKRFEVVVAKIFEQGGNRAEVARIGPDGGVDIKVYSQGQQEPAAFVQCKAWNSYKVGVKPVRELFGVMAAEGIGTGFFATSGEFTFEARQFASGKTVTLLDGTDLMDEIQGFPDDQKRKLYKLATAGDYTTPSCPSCGLKLVKRISKKGRNPGDAFWGCPAYPRCRYKMRMRGEAA